MKGLKKRVADLEQANGGINWIMLSVHHTADGRIRYDGQVYADTAALREAKGIPQDTFVQFIHWNFDSVPDEKPSPCEVDAVVENRPDEQETPQVPVGSVEGIEGSPTTENTVFNPFMRPMPEHLKPRQTHAIMPKSLFGADSVFGDYAAPYWRD